MVKMPVKPIGLSQEYNARHRIVYNFWTPGMQEGTRDARFEKDHRGNKANMGDYRIKGALLAGAEGRSELESMFKNIAIRTCYFLHL